MEISTGRNDVDVVVPVSGDLGIGRVSRVANSLFVTALGATPSDHVKLKNRAFDRLPDLMPFRSGAPYTTSWGEVLS